MPPDIGAQIASVTEYCCINELAGNFAGDQLFSHIRSWEAHLHFRPRTPL